MTPARHAMLTEALTTAKEAWEQEAYDCGKTPERFEHRLTQLQEFIRLARFELEGLEEEIRPA